MWDACTPRRTDIWAGHTGWISGVSSAGGTALTSSFDRTLRVWDRETGQWSHVLKGHSGQVTCCALGDGGITAASGSRDRTVRMWAVQREECTDTFSTPENSGPVGGVAFAGGLVVAAYNDGRARAWDPRSGKIARTLAGHDGPVFGVAADGLTVATCGADRQCEKCPRPTARYLGVLGSANGAAQPFPSRSVHVWDLGSGDCKASLSGHDDGVLGVDILGDVVASGGLEGEVRVWSAVTWRCCHVLRGHEDWVRSVALRRDRVASSSRDGTVRTWSVDRGELLGTLPCGGADVRAVCMDDEYVLAGAVDGSVRAWAFGAEEMP